MRRWRGLKSLVHDAVDVTTALIEEGHEATARTVIRAVDLVDPGNATAREVDAARRAATAATLASVRAVNRAVARVTDIALDLAAPEAPPARDALPMRSDGMRSAAWLGDAALGAINGLVGDHLAAQGNGLDLGMSLRVADRYVAPEDLARAVTEPTDRLVVFVHGLCATEWSWCLGAAEYHGDPAVNFGTLLARDVGVTPVFIRYNTGQHVSTNGRCLAALLDRVMAAWPVPGASVSLVGHSMGGLVARSAAHHADLDGLPWRRALTHVACLGSPHRGAPLEKAGHALAAALMAVDLPGTRIPGRILRGRSAGIKDLRHGDVFDEDWRGLDPDALVSRAPRELALLDDVSYAFIAGSVTRDPDHPLAVAVGDLLVREASAAPNALRRSEFSIELPRFGAVMHHQLQAHPDVYAALRRFLAR